MKDCACPIDVVATTLGKKWVIILLRDLFLGKTQFKEFLEANPELSNKVLAQKLKDMEKDGLIKRVVDRTVRYELTAEGKQLKPVLKAMVQFGKAHCTSKKNYSTLLEKLH